VAGAQRPAADRPPTRPPALDTRVAKKPSKRLRLGVCSPGGGFFALELPYPAPLSQRDGGASRGCGKVTSGHKSTARRLTPNTLPSKITKREISGKKTPKTGMSPDTNPPNAVEQAVSRALRDNLERIQRMSDELHQSIADVVASCASSKPTNALPPMLRAQTAAASLSAALDVLSRFVAMALQPGPRSPFEAEIARIAGTMAVAEPAPVSKPAPAPPVVTPAPRVVEEHREPPREVHPQHPAPEAAEDEGAFTGDAAVESEYETEFNVSRLSAEEQELHRRANRVAKVSMQDIKMLRPEQVRLGREHKDICIRLRDDIEKAHREYDRRFKPIMDHPVDYFYRWMVEILAEGDAHALGEYPYATTVRHH
jgi:hypothetical protein